MQTGLPRSFRLRDIQWSIGADWQVRGKPLPARTSDRPRRHRAELPPKAILSDVLLRASLLLRAIYRYLSLPTAEHQTLQRNDATTSAIQVPADSNPNANTSSIHRDAPDVTIRVEAAKNKASFLLRRYHSWLRCETNWDRSDKWFDAHVR